VATAVPLTDGSRVAAARAIFSVFPEHARRDAMSSTQLQTTTQYWVVDSSRSVVEFEVQNFWGLAKVVGHFDHFEGSYTTGSEGSSLELTIEADSIDTGNERRDHHLRTHDFFDTAEFPYIRFSSHDLVDLGEGRVRVSGELEVVGIPQPLVFEAIVRDLDDELEAEATTTVDARKYGMSSGPLWSIRPLATLHVKTRFTREP
jgi:polyisoprenoid-binding protein YceI